MYKKFLIILIIFLINGCGYTPIYLDSSKYNFSIGSIEFTGDRKINNLIKFDLKKFQDKESKNKINIDVKSEYSKSILSKDLKGQTTDYVIEIKTTFIAKTSINSKSISINKNFLMKNINNVIEENDYEKTVLKNLVEAIIQELILEISNFQ